MPFKFEKLRVWRQSLEYLDLVYEVARLLPRSEEFNLKSQVIRAATSIALNIAEGSTSQSDAEQARFLSIAIRSLVEIVACRHIIERRRLISDSDLLHRLYTEAEALAASLHALRRSLTPEQYGVREEIAGYDEGEGGV
jgi:four helix bundle protein